MLPEERELLEKTLALAEENNKILQGIKRSMRIGRWWKIIYWTLVVGTALGAYYFIQPYIDQVISVYGGAKSNIEGINSLLDTWRK